MKIFTKKMEKKLIVEHRQYGWLQAFSKYIN